MPSKKFNGTLRRAYTGVGAGKKVFAEEMTCEITLTTNEIPTGSKDDGNWYDFAAGEKSWEVKVSSQQDYTTSTTKFNYAATVDAWMNETVLDVLISTEIVGDFTIGGKAMIVSVGEKDERNGIATADFTLKGKGALTKALNV